MLISRTCAWSIQIFLPPKEAQGEVRQSQGRAAANNFAFLRSSIHNHYSKVLFWHVLFHFVDLLDQWQLNCVSLGEKCPNHSNFVLRRVVRLKREILVRVSSIHANFNATIRLRVTKVSKNGKHPSFSWSLVNLMWGSKLLMWSVKSWARSLSITTNVSSTYRIQIRGGWEAGVIALTSKFSMYKLAIIELTGSPIAHPWYCWYICLLNLK